MIWCGRPSRVMVRPTTDGSAPNRLRHALAETSTTASFPFSSSAGVKVRPKVGWTRSASKKPEVTARISTRSARSVRSDAVWRVTPPEASKSGNARRSVTTSGGERPPCFQPYPRCSAPSCWSS